MKIGKIIKYVLLGALVLNIGNGVIRYFSTEPTNTDVVEEEVVVKTEELKMTDDKTSNLDNLILKARDDYDNTPEEKGDIVTNFGSDIYQYITSEIQFSTDEIMEEIIYKGAFIEEFGKEGIEMGSTEEVKNISHLFNQLGMDAVQMVKYIYRGAETPTDQATISNINQFIESYNMLSN